MSDKVILYDLANRKNVGWSPNPWKSRIALNYKNIPYETEWVEYPDLASKFKSFGIPPNPPGEFAEYSSPTVRFPDGKYVMNSATIAEELEARYPEPSLHLNPSLDKEAGQVCGALIMGVLPDFMVTVLHEWLDEPSRSWFAEDRKRRLGMTLEEFAKVKGGEAAWPGTEEGLKKLQGLLTAHKKDEGPFILGSTVSYGDFIIVTLFEGLERIRKDRYEKLVAYDERFKKLHEACRPWLKKDD